MHVHVHVRDAQLYMYMNHGVVHVRKLRIARIPCADVSCDSDLIRLLPNVSQLFLSPHVHVRFLHLLRIEGKRHFGHHSRDMMFCLFVHVLVVSWLHFTGKFPNITGSGILGNDLNNTRIFTVPVRLVYSETSILNLT